MDSSPFALSVAGKISEKNGWDPNEMFKKNAEKFGVTSTYDSTLQGYTIPLEPKNTEEYKKQEAKAVKIAQEIENSQQYLSRIAVENGDEEEKYSAVVRPSESTQTSSKRRSGPGNKPVRNVIPSSSLYSSKTSQHAISPVYSQCHKSTASVPSPISNPVTTSSPICVSSKPPLPPQASVTPTQQQPVHPCQPQNTANNQESKEKRVNGASVPFECKIQDPKLTSKTESKENIPCVMQVTSSEVVMPEQVTTVAKPNQRRKDQEKKGGNPKGRDEQLAEFKRFSSDFRLLEEPKEQREQHKDFMQLKTESVAAAPESNNISKDTSDKGSEKQMEVAKNVPVTDIGIPTAPDSAGEKLDFNPNEREFTLNPNAKSFTPRTSLSVSTSPAPVVIHQHRMHTQSPVVALPQQPMVLGMGQPTFTTMQPQYVVSSPCNMSLTPQFPQPVGVSQGHRFKKSNQIAMQQQRQDIMPCVHVAAATGQPILAPATIPTPPQLAMPYPSQAVVQAGGPQPGMPYAQVYPVISRMMSPQPVGMVPTSPTVSYGEYVQVAGHIYMSPQMGVPVSGVQNFIPQASSGPHSAPSTPQSQTPGTPFHAPSSIHQPPTGAPYVTSVQTPTPAVQAGHAHTPQPVVYSQMMPQPSMLHPGHQSLNTSQAPHLTQNHSHPHHISFSGAPQSMILMPHGHYSVASGHHAFQGHPSHGHSPGNHSGTPTNIIPPMPMTIIPTSCAMGPNPMVSAPFIAHPQGTSQPNPVQPYPLSH
ncbi:uncharacterized protein LOC143238062 isoform X2 [Tachypleus tridentatus]|uniref:uncharacterized protein LOC143238062 isoform X2 n=1 Tax=Tachypleus tridentatus TaxID=6853 RepID=UPI003FCF9868